MLIENKVRDAMLVYLIRIITDRDVSLSTSHSDNSRKPVYACRLVWLGKINRVCVADERLSGHSCKIYYCLTTTFLIKQDPSHRFQVHWLVRMACSDLQLGNISSVTIRYGDKLAFFGCGITTDFLSMQAVEWISGKAVADRLDKRKLQQEIDTHKLYLLTSYFQAASTGTPSQDAVEKISADSQALSKEVSVLCKNTHISVCKPCVIGWARSHSSVWSVYWVEWVRHSCVDFRLY